MAVGETQHFPTFEREGQYITGTNVYFEAFCSCGGIRRVRGPVEEVIKFVQNWDQAHTGPGHSEVDKVTCCKAREELRRTSAEAALKNDNVDNNDLVEKGLMTATKLEPGDEGFDPAVEGDQFRYEYVPTNWDEKNIGVTNEEVYA